MLLLPCCDEVLFFGCFCYSDCCCYYHIRELSGICSYFDSVATFQNINLIGSNRFKTVLLVLLLRLLIPHTSLPFSDLSTGLRPTNALNINFFLLFTKFLQPVNLAILTIWSLFNITVLAPHLLSLFLTHQPSPHWKPQITHPHMHHPQHPVSNQLPDSSHQPHQSFTTRVLIYLSARICHHHLRCDVGLEEGEYK